MEKTMKPKSKSFWQMPVSPARAASVAVTGLLVLFSIFAIGCRASLERMAHREIEKRPVSEVYLRRLPEIDKIAISLSKESVMVSYKPGAAFRPKDLRDALQKTEVGIVQLQISARGRLQREGGKQFFIAGKDKFALVPSANAPQPPADTPVLIEGILNDRIQPMELKIMTVTRLKQ